MNAKESDSKFTVERLPGGTPLHPDEPVFVFRASDHHMADVLSCYAIMCRDDDAKHPVTKAHIRAIKDHQRAVLKWQKANPRLVGSPD